MGQIQPRRNNLGAWGWVFGGNYKLERYLYILHRVTGLGILLFGLLHLTETTVFRIQGKSTWEATVGFLENPIFEIGLFLVAAAFCIHALNGLRLILQEFGFTMGKPTRPIFPYGDALRRKRAFAMTMMAIMVVLALVFMYDFIGGGP